jgi:hypothetical protein
MVLIEVRQDLGVAPAPEVMPGLLELLAQFQVVVELAVLDRPDGTVLVPERLVSARDVDDAQTPRSERDARGEIRPSIVRASMRHDVGHAIQGRLIQGLPSFAAELDRSADATHRPLSLGARRSALDDR